MANVILSKLATDNINEILANVYEFTGFISTPEKLLAEFEKTFRLIAFMPDAIGRLCEHGEREAFCRNYRIIYRAIEETVYIKTVVHSRRLYPQPSFSP